MAKNHDLVIRGLHVWGHRDGLAHRGFVVAGDHGVEIDVFAFDSLLRKSHHQKPSGLGVDVIQIIDQALVLAIAIKPLFAVDATVQRRSDRA